MQDKLSHKLYIFFKLKIVQFFCLGSKPHTLDDALLSFVDYIQAWKNMSINEAWKKSLAVLGPLWSN